MSARNGDKSRFNRERKQKIARRKHTRELLEHAARREVSGTPQSVRSQGRRRREQSAASVAAALCANFHRPKRSECC